MNDFIRLRQEHVHSIEPDRFTLAFLEWYRKNNHINDPAEHSMIRAIEHLHHLAKQPYIHEEDVLTLMNAFGIHRYLDKWILDFMLDHHQLVGDTAFAWKVGSLLRESLENPLLIISLLDLCIEGNRPVVTAEMVRDMLHVHSKHLEVISQIIDYERHFPDGALDDVWFGMLTEELPVTIRIQLKMMLLETDRVDPERPEWRNMEDDLRVYSDLALLLERPFTSEIDGKLIMQTMFQGDFDGDGKGNNGGMAVLLKQLGNAMAQESEIGAVISMTIPGEWTAEMPLIKRVTGGHWLLRLPLYVDPESEDPYLLRERFIARFTENFLERIAVHPDLIHVRYLDNASSAMGLLCKNIGSKLAFTLTPDPHRRMVDAGGRMQSFDTDQLLRRLNRIFIGDALILQSDALVGIGREGVRGDLEDYFPQLRLPEIVGRFTMVDEAVRLSIKADSIQSPLLPEGFYEQPIILNVGRLNELKGQVRLLKAWGESKLWQHYSLLLVGGNLENPSAEERDVLDQIAAYLRGRTYLKDRFLHLGAMANEQIRLLERRIMNHQGERANVYLCSSLKEEFGIAIVEAMAEGYLVLAPENGGAKSYIREGDNGFLIDTSDWEILAQQAEAILLDPERDTDALIIQKKAHETVKGSYTMEKIARDMLDVYRTIGRRLAA